MILIFLILYESSFFHFQENRSYWSETRQEANDTSPRRDVSFSYLDEACIKNILVFDSFGGVEDLLDGEALLEGQFPPPLDIVDPPFAQTTFCANHGEFFPLGVGLWLN